MGVKSFGFTGAGAAGLILGAAYVMAGIGLADMGLEGGAARAAGRAISNKAEPVAFSVFFRHSRDTR